MKKMDEGIQFDFERFGAGGFKSMGDAQTSEATRVHESKLSARG